MSAPESAAPEGPLGASVDGSATRFLVWAPEADHVIARLEDEGRDVPLEPVGSGYHLGFAEGVAAGARYRYVLDGGDPLPDPASRHQPDGPQGASAVAGGFEWSDGTWAGCTLDDLVISEIHVGCFTAEGTFDAAVAELDRLAEVGITAVELMPVAEFPGARNWGYDGVLPSAADSSYGGPDGLRRFVDAAHARGLAVILDVVDNHLGPEGNVLSRYGPYFTDRYRTPWGDAVNVEGPGSDEVRRFFIDSARWWVLDCHIDGLRLDAVHAIADQTAYPFVEQLADEVRAAAADAGRSVVIIAESSDNDPRMIRSKALGGWDLDGVWDDDVHHALHTLLTGESDGYYADYGTLADLEACYRDGWVFQGRYSHARGRHHGRPLGDVERHRLVACAQNHDQVGNRMLGERLTVLVDDARLRLAAAAVLLSPFTPLLFMGEEYGETAPFLYFVSHDSDALNQAVREGRAAEFAAFGWDREPPDPAAPETFEASKLQPHLRDEPGHRQLLVLHRTLIDLRRRVPTLTMPTATTATARHDASRTLVVHRCDPDGHHPDAVLILHVGPGAVAMPELPDGSWRCVLATEAFPDVPDEVTELAPWSAVLLVEA